MFKSAAAKLAHNSTLPSLGASKDLRPLQDLITAEKAVLQTLQKLSTDFIRSSEYLKAWGHAEGDDLADTLAVSQQLLGYIASAFGQLAIHQQTVREYMKAVRTREENLDEMRKRRKNTISRADTAEKKLSKMSPEHKSLLQQTELLNTLRDQIRTMDWEIMCEEARLGDFKRTSTKNWMMLKFGGLLECAEKATIVGELGKLVIEEIPLDPTTPGQARAFYTGHEKTEKLLEEARRCLSEVVFDPKPISESPKAATFTQPQRQPEQSFTNSPQLAHPPHPGLPEPSHDERSPQQSGYGGDSNRPSQDYLGGPHAGSASDAYGHHQDYSQSSYASQSMRNAPSADEFGYSDWRGGNNAYSTMPAAGGPRFQQQYDASGSNPTSPVATGPSGGSHFATLPVGRTGSGFQQPQDYSYRPTPPQQSYRPLDEDRFDNTASRGRHERETATSFSAEVAGALSTDPTFNDPAPNALSPTAAVGGDASLYRGDSKSSNGPLPRYEAHYESPVVATGLPKGAAPPNVKGVDSSANPWNSSSSSSIPDQGSSSGAKEPEQPPAFGHDAKDHRLSHVSEGSTELPYASGSGAADGYGAQHQQQHPDRHVHFGSEKTIDDGYGYDGQGGDARGYYNTPAKVDAEGTRSGPGNDKHNDGQQRSYEDYGTVVGTSSGHGEKQVQGQPPEMASTHTENYSTKPTTESESNDTPEVGAGRSPVAEPNVRLDEPQAQVGDGNNVTTTTTKEEDEDARNAAAAKEVAKEMETSISIPPPSFGVGAGVPATRTPSPLVPPAPPFAQQQSHTGQYSTETAPFGQSPPRVSAFGGPAVSSPLPPIPSSARSATPPVSSSLGQSESIPQPSRSALGMGLPGSIPSAQMSRASSYGTPPEYPSPGTGSSFRPPQSSPPMTPLTPGTRTISASAFKRGPSRSPAASDTNFGSPVSSPLPEITPLSVRRKPLPDVGDIHEGSVPLRQAPAPSSTQADDPENFDYLAFVVDYSNSPRSGTHQNPQPPPPGAAQGHLPGEAPQNISAGYGSGKFSTNLEDLR